MENKKIIFRTFMLCFLLSPSISYAALMDCGFKNIKHLYVNGTRDDGSPHSNRLLIEFESGGTCNGQSLVYIENTEPAYNSFLSTALAAFSTGKQVRIYINSSNTNQIALIQLKQ